MQCSETILSNVLHYELLLYITYRRDTFLAMLASGHYSLYFGHNDLQVICATFLLMWEGGKMMYINPIDFGRVLPAVGLVFNWQIKINACGVFRVEILL